MKRATTNGPVERTPESCSTDVLGNPDQGSYMDYVVRRQIECCWRVESSMGECLWKLQKFGGRIEKLAVARKVCVIKGTLKTKQNKTKLNAQGQTLLAVTWARLILQTRMQGADY